MRNIVVRIAVGATGALLFLLGAVAWIDPLRLALKLGVQPAAPLGAATLRADLGAFFAVAGGMAVLAAIRRAPTLLNTPLLLIGLALAGRFLALALAVAPFDASMIQPMVAEAFMVAVFAAGRFLADAP